MKSVNLAKSHPIDLNKVSSKLLQRFYGISRT